MRPQVTLAIPCRDGEATLGLVLDGVARQERAPDELLVIDDGSADGTAALARRRGARVIVHGENRGLAAARNTALREAAGAVVVFLDADAVPEPQLLVRLTAGYEDDPALAAVGGQLLERAVGALADRWRAHFWRQTQGEQRLERAPFVVGACCSLRRAAALAAGGFSASFRTNGEDVELSVRLRRAGLRLAYDPAARALHLRRDDVPSLLSMIYRHSRDHVRALRLHGEPSRQVVVAAARWGPVTLVSSLRRHRSPALALLSPLCYGAALAGCAAGALAR